MIYKVETIKDGTEKYFFIRNLETMSIEELPSKYLMHKIKCKRSPNTVKRTAFSICYYMKYMAEKEMELTEVYQLDYEKQTEHFVEFLYWLKAGNHTEQTAGEKKCPNEGTCNAYLKDVFRFYLFIEAEYEQYGSLKTLSYNQIIAVNQVGVKKVLRNHSFKAYLKEEEHRGRTAKENQIITILQACTNRRDQLLLLMLAETGYRIGDDDDKIRLNQRKPSKYKGLRRFGPEKNLQRINKFMKERPIFYKNLIQMKENIRFYLRCFYCITKVMILQFNSENRTELARNG